MARRRRKLPQSIHQATIESYNHELKGVARINGKATFIQEALPDEEVSFKYSLKKNNYDEGYVVEVIKASDKRILPKCPHFQLCGGCSLQHLAPEDQIQAKQQILLDHFSNIARIEPNELLQPLQAASWGYRNKARLSVRFIEKKQSVLVGFREKRNGRFITDIERCEVLNPAIGHHIRELRDLIESLEGYRDIAQIEVAAGDESLALIIRHMEALTDSDSQLLIHFVKEKNFHLYLQPSNPASIHKIWPLDSNDYLSYHLEKFALDFQFKPNDFTQVNPSMNQLMVEQAVNLLDLTVQDTVLDLFCGLGNFSLPIATRAQYVTGIEGCDKMVASAKSNARLNNLDNTDFYSADLTKTLTGQWVKQYDKLLIDPPRSGAKEIVEQIELFNCTRLVYISCNPATLARDSDILVNQKGYTLSKAGVMDMFPHTTHVESIALFKK